MTTTTVLSGILAFVVGWAINRPGDFFRAKPEHPKLDPETLHALLDLFMASDPWPLDGRSEHRIRTLLNREAAARGYTDWIDALRTMGEARP